MVAKVIAMVTGLANHCFNIDVDIVALFAWVNYGSILAIAIAIDMAFAN